MSDSGIIPLAVNVDRLDDDAIERVVDDPEDLAGRWVLTNWSGDRHASFIYGATAVFEKGDHERGFVNPPRVGTDYYSRDYLLGPAWRFVGLGQTLTFAGVEDVRRELDRQLADHDRRFESLDRPDSIFGRIVGSVLGGLMGALMVVGLVVLVTSSSPTAALVAGCVAWPILSVSIHLAERAYTRDQRRKREAAQPARDTIVAMLDTLEQRMPRTDRA